MGFRSLFSKKKKTQKKMTPSSLSLPSPSPAPNSHTLPLSSLSSHSHASFIVAEEELEYVFEKFDKNGDGKISASELGSMMKSLGQPATEPELLKMIREVDSDGDGHIDLHEFVTLNTKGVDSDEVLENLKDAFSIFDVDGNGSISAEELNMVMASLGEAYSIDECRKMIAGIDGDGDGMINFHEFQLMMTGSHGKK